MQFKNRFMQKGKKKLTIQSIQLVYYFELGRHT